jgi:thymidylate synthase (FAD)
VSNRVQVLDHGYLELIDHWGRDLPAGITEVGDEAIIAAARMSTSGGFVSWEPYEDHPRGDLGLLSYLYQKKHSTPFEMCGMTIEAQAPIMVFREWHRHRTQSYNEMSARYTPLPDVNYRPTTERCLVVSGSNKQAGRVKDADELTHESVLAWLAELDGVYRHCEEVYQNGLRRGIPKELARLCIPVGRYSRMRASANLRNWLAFLTLRMDPAAQFETRQFANAVGEMVAKYFPRTWLLFTEKRS